MTTLLVEDNAIPNSVQFREAALAIDYQTVSYQGFDFPGVGLNGGLQKDLADALSNAVRRGLGFYPDFKLVFFRLTRKDDRHPVHIHADNVVGAKWAAVWYLTPDEHCVGGTAFWTHRATGAEGLPAGFDHTSKQAAQLDEDGRNEDLWCMNGLVGMKFNRLAIYPCNLFHSRYPLKFPGDTVETGRLVGVAFFNE